MATVEVPGIVHVYENDGVLPGPNDPKVTFDLIEPIGPFTQTHIGSQSGATDDLVGTATDFTISGTTLEFGDLDGDGDLDMFVNSKPIAGNSMSSESPVIYRNRLEQLGPTIDLNLIYEPHTNWNVSGINNENAFCGSFGMYNGQLALAVGSFDFHQGHDVGYDQIRFHRCGNDIYTFENGSLVHVAQSDWNEALDVLQPQMVSDIQWANLDAGSAIDLVAASYPCINSNQGSSNEGFVRGLEQIHLNPDNLTQNHFTTSNWTAEPDRSTSLALGDIDDPDGDEPQYAYFNCGNTINKKGLHYLPYFPAYKIAEIRYDTSPQGTFGSLIPNTEWCADLYNGWFSVNQSYLSGLVDYGDALYLKVKYYYSLQYDLAIGNDGENVVYFNGPGGSSYSPTNTQRWVEQPGSYEYDSEERYGFSASDPNVDLRVSDGLGATDGEALSPGYRNYDLEQELTDHPNLARFGLMPYWYYTEVFQGHYYWNWWDTRLETIRSLGRKSHICSWSTPMWCRGNYDPNQTDPRDRTSDERLYAMWVRNLVNRYRPGGICSQTYTWSSDEGVTIYQFENEPNAASYGYGGFEQQILNDVSEKLYRQYQMIRTIEANDEEDVMLEVVAPNFCQTNTPATNPEDYYSLPPLPYLHALNNTDWNSDQYYDLALWKYCDLFCQQSYCNKPPEESIPGLFSINSQDPCSYVPCTTVPNEKRMIGMEHMLWGYYTEGIADYIDSQTPSEWEPLVPIATDPDYEKPFFIMEWCFPAYPPGELYYPPEILRARTASQAAELLSIDAFPNDDQKHHYLVRYSVPWLGSDWGYYARDIDTFAKLYNGKAFVSYDYDPFTGDEPDPTDRITISFSGGPAGDGVDFLRTYTAPIETSNNFYLNNQNLQSGARLPVYSVSGEYTDRGISITDNLPHIEFAANELRHDEVLMIVEDVDAQQSSTFSQAIQLERGWNLVSWYIWPPDPNTPPLYMDDLFANQTPVQWFQYNQTTPIDKVGAYNASPHTETFYPKWGSQGGMGSEWIWNLRQAYPIYLDEEQSAAHFWEFSNRPLYEGETPADDDIYPSNAWDDYEQLGLVNPWATETFWYFISYPIRKQIKVEDSNTINWLMAQSNPLMIIKDDAGNFFTQYVERDSYPLEYLQPGKGYFLGFDSATPLVDCPWFLGNEGSVPEYIPPSPKEQSQAIASGSHFQFKSRTHWSYPVIIDTIIVNDLSPDVGDEIGVFDGDLCVGATTFDGQYPILFSAWMDDIATPADRDGYFVGGEMTFIWYDVSENSEITFNPPPMTAATEPEVNPYFPTHSGFGTGFAAHRSLGYGVQEINQLPKIYSLGQNYPNPFNAETVIPLALPQRSKVQINVYNIKGQLVSRLFNGVQNAGHAQIRYNASRLPSGMYFYRVTAEGLERGGRYSDVGKMLLLK
ncbi:T9SS type A sorting domain-containing protein [bacterium]|nr:T9SS type A sorting domain-containing protein [bacterium]